MSVEKQLVERYSQILEISNPGLKAVKNPNGSLELSHIKWMLEKMKSDEFVHKTSSLHWIGWIQAALYSANLIQIKHEKDTTREISKQIKEEG